MVPSKILGGGDGDAYVPFQISEIFNINLYSVSHFSYCLLWCVHSSKSCNIMWEIAYYFVFISSDIENT